MRSSIAVGAILTAFCSVPAAAEITAHDSKVVGTWGNLESWQALDQPFCAGPAR